MALVYLPIHDLVDSYGKCTVNIPYMDSMGIYMYVNCELGSKYIENWKISCVFCCCNAFLEKTGRKNLPNTSCPHTFGWHPSMENN